jgi:hypothetical protein
MPDCPNCATPVEEGAALCPSCGFHMDSQHAAEVRRLREQGRIHPGRMSGSEHGGAPAPESAPDPPPA